jgi:hypothetical protein
MVDKSIGTGSDVDEIELPNTFVIHPSRDIGNWPRICVTTVQARKRWYCSSLLLRVQLFLEFFDGLLPLRLLVLHSG